MQQTNGLIQIKPPRIALTLLGGAIALHYLTPEREWLHFSQPIPGALVAALGFIVMMWGWGLFQKTDTALLPTAKSTTFVIQGPFRWTRNPMYLGMVLILLGTAILLGTLSAFLAPVAFFMAINQVFIPYEEEDMEATFGEDYLNYKKRVRRWI